ncbi:GNAT family N-acetyltransferase [Halopseudomonas aestusnigri]|uniref:Acetyltransferase n=1 Tax=Halopseudomonas aestusnigri TaxID=857252 RepID=A0AAQ1JQR0_9GAMM|nr:GNAT family N-acetyltransferase [Halopseudomonas aestusnigri]UGV29986.1 GNAT family N-acetyltransferase [Halopseudomonas aestusnigri]GMQ55317.1 hypothetical protein YSKK_31810 [Halopseudomonas aestusnigri]SEG54975.1 putative acetyltransferase [Halopseudomonas aestusnigri]
MSRVLRCAQPADYERCVSLFTRSVHTLAASDYDTAQRLAWAPLEPDLPAWRQRLDSVQLWLLEEAGVLLGFIGFSTDGHIDLLYCAPEAARDGVASQLLAHAESRMRAAGAEQFRTEASLVARPFFLRHGYRVTAQQWVQRGAIRLLRCEMHKQIRRETADAAGRGESAAGQIDDGGDGGVRAR